MLAVYLTMSLSLSSFSGQSTAAGLPPPPGPGLLFCTASEASLAAALGVSWPQVRFHGPSNAQGANQAGPE